MEFNKLTDERRSVRKFKAGKTIEPGVIREMIETALKAPSWKNTETGRYYVAISKEKINEVRDTCLPPFNQTNSLNASAIIVTTFYKNLSGFMTGNEAVNELGNGWGLYDLGLQTGYLVLKARDMGLDTLIMGIRNGKELKHIFGIPDSELIVSVIAVGYRDYEPETPKRKKVEEICKFFM